MILFLKWWLYAYLGVYSPYILTDFYLVGNILLLSSWITWKQVAVITPQPPWDFSIYFTNQGHLPPYHHYIQTSKHHHPGHISHSNFVKSFNNFHLVQNVIQNYILCLLIKSLNCPLIWNNSSMLIYFHDYTNIIEWRPLILLDTNLRLFGVPHDHTQATHSWHKYCIYSVMDLGSNRLVKRIYQDGE